MNLSKKELKNIDAVAVELPGEAIFSLPEKVLQFGTGVLLRALPDYFIDKAIPTGWTTIVTLLLFISGIQLIFIGILGVYIGGIYEEVKGRPHYIIDQTTNIEP